jgi:hypothetical protein
MVNIIDIDCAVRFASQRENDYQLGCSDKNKEIFERMSSFICNKSI